MNSMDLSHCCDCDKDSDAWTVSWGICQLNFEWRHCISIILLRTDFETIKEKCMVDETRCHESNFSEWQNDLDVFTLITSSKRSRVNLIVSRFNVFAIFSNEGKSYSCPESVSPMSSNKERNYCHTFALDRLDGEEEVVGWSTFKIMDGCVRWKLPTATYGTDAKS